MRPSVTAGLPWALRALWLALPFTAGTVLAGALDETSVPVRTTASLGAWLAWAVVVLALLVAHPVSLTVVRVVAPAALAATLAAAAGGRAGGLASAFGVTMSVAVVALAFLPETGTWLVNGASYGDERRHLLRPPSALVAGPVPLAWLVLVAAVTGGPLLLAAGRWVAGALALLVGVPVAVVSARALHALSQRWAVLVPAGLVLKDHLTVVDAVLLRRTDIEVLAPAPAGTDSLDLTAGARGVALEARLHEAIPLIRVRPGRRQGEPGRSAALRFSPTRPGTVLVEARARRVRTG
ncbi:MAG TPA: hypothetical protein VK975_00485 [Acidimicrobiales bacterium]|nr:hypothetical protein [Acidimicrobiales bacterium]